MSGPPPAGMPPGEHLDRVREALVLEAEAQRRLLDGDAAGARAGLLRVTERYRASWEVAPPRSFGRLIGMLKAAVIAGEAEGPARYALAEVAASDSPAAGYTVAIAAAVVGDGGRLAEGTVAMRAGDAAFGRAADALDALATGSRERYRAAVESIVRDFEGRECHLTGVPIADTALMLEVLAESRGMAARPASPLLPAAR